MFGRKPQLPIDALLGTAEEYRGEGTVGEWLQDHQEFLQFMFTSAEKQLKHAAAQRAQQQQTGVAPMLPVDTLVYRKRHAPGRNKIQDIWDNTRYKITKCLDDVGRVYTISPIDTQGPAKNIHRSELRVIPGQATPNAIANPDFTVDREHCSPGDKPDDSSEQDEDEGRWTMRHGGSPSQQQRPLQLNHMTTSPGPLPAIPAGGESPERNSSAVSPWNGGADSMLQEATPPTGPGPVDQGPRTHTSQTPPVTLRQSNDQPQLFIPIPLTFPAPRPNHRGLWGPQLTRALVIQ